MTTHPYQHTSVLLTEAIDALQILSDPEGAYLDATFGCGGHTQAMLNQLAPAGRLLAIDQDPSAMLIAQNISDQRFTFMQGPFSHMPIYADQAGINGNISGILFDLGVSSPQLDNPERGFSFMHDGPLDMRMNNQTGMSAADWLKDADEAEIAAVLKKFGQERFAKKIARVIVKQQTITPMTRTKQLADLIAHTMPIRSKGKHPATRSFQAIRIYLNQELNEIEEALNHALTLLKPGGRLVVIDFHSLEDTIIKQFMRQHSKRPLLPAGLPLTEAQYHQITPTPQLINVGRILPSAQEIMVNRRARSAVLRFAQRTHANVI